MSIDGYEDVPAGDEDALLRAATAQPVAVGICASPEMQFYRGGVLDKCCDELNHGVLLVGYGADAKEQEGLQEKGDGKGGDGRYYLVKNSWGGGWGEAGYFRLRVGASQEGGLCGIATTASYPVKSATCSCRLPFFFNLFCVRHDCCPVENGVGCADNAHCCPADKPVCDTAAGLCWSQDGKESVAWIGKEPAKVASTAALKASGEATLARRLAASSALISGISISARNGSPNEDCTVTRPKASA